MKSWLMAQWFAVAWAKEQKIHPGKGKIWTPWEGAMTSPGQSIPVTEWALGIHHLRDFSPGLSWDQDRIILVLFFLSVLWFCLSFAYECKFCNPFFDVELPLRKSCSQRGNLLEVLTLPGYRAFPILRLGLPSCPLGILS